MSGEQLAGVRSGQAAQVGAAHRAAQAAAEQEAPREAAARLVAIALAQEQAQARPDPHPPHVWGQGSVTVLNWLP